MSRSWYVEQNGRTVGPMNSDELKQLATAGKISRTTSVRLGEDGEWVSASKVKGLFPADILIPAPQPQVPQPQPATPPSQVVVAPIAEPRTIGSPQFECPFCAEVIAENAKNVSTAESFSILHYVPLLKHDTRRHHRKYSLMLLVVPHMLRLFQVLMQTQLRKPNQG